MLSFAVVFFITAVCCLVLTFTSFASGRGVSAASVVLLVFNTLLSAILFLKKDDAVCEYDYIIENDTLSFVKIRNLSSRKELIALKPENLKRIMPFDENNFRQLQAKKINCTLNKENRCILLAGSGGENYAIAFEPKEELLAIIKKELK